MENKRIQEAIQNAEKELKEMENPLQEGVELVELIIKDLRESNK